MKTIISVFKNLKNIESKPKRFLIGFSTVIFAFEMIWCISFVIIVLSRMLCSVPFLSSFFLKVLLNVNVTAFAIPSLYLFPYLGIASIAILTVTVFFANRYIKCNSSNNYLLFYILCIFINPSLYGAIYMAIKVIRIGISFIGY